MSRIVEIKWSDSALFESDDEGLGIDIFGGEAGRLYAQATDEQIERMREAGFEVNVLFESVEAYIAAFESGQEGDA